MSALARLGSWAFDRGEVDRNVLDKVTRVYHSDRVDKLWLPAHVAAFVCMASSEMKAAAHHTQAKQGRQGGLDPLHKGAARNAR